MLFQSTQKRIDTATPVCSPVKSGDTVTVALDLVGAAYTSRCVCLLKPTPAPIAVPNAPPARARDAPLNSECPGQYDCSKAHSQAAKISPAPAPDAAPTIAPTRSRLCV